MRHCIVAELVLFRSPLNEEDDLAETWNVGGTSSYVNDVLLDNALVEAPVRALWLGDLLVDLSELPQLLLKDADDVRVAIGVDEILGDLTT